jgi:PAS domain S-box-containing protein
MSRRREPEDSPSESNGESLAVAVVQNSVDGLAVADREGRYTLWNQAMERFTGRSAAEVLGRRAFEVFPYLRENGLDRAAERVLAGEVVAIDGLEHLEADGTRKVYDRLYLPLRSRRGEITGVIGIVRDSTARHAAQHALRKSEVKLRMAADAAGVGLWSWVPATDEVEWEDTMCAIFGRPPGTPPKGRSDFVLLIHPDERARVIERVAGWKTLGEWEDEYRIIRPDGAVRWVMSKARVLHTDRGEMVLGAAFDVTERKEREQRQRATQRLEVVGQLTAGIAHNFNNMLMGLLPNLELAARRAPADLVPLLREAQQSGERAVNLVRQLMTYAGRNRKADRRVEPLAAFVERTVAFCRTTFDPRIELDVRCEEGVAARIDGTLLEQALLNILINARDALEGPAVVSPRIVVRAERVPAGTPELEGRDGEWACIRVTDNGLGMDASTVQYVYEPFFTTKEAGKGTGLGLATTQGIVREHGGFITCKAAPGRGATFAIYLPRPRFDETSSERVIRTPPSGPHPVARGTVMLVDDEEPVRKVVTLMLRDAGIDVVTARSGEEAIDHIADPAVAARIALVLLDVSMPGMSGTQLRVRLRELLPHARVAFLTGYPYEADEEDAVLEKPLSGRQLIATVRAMLAAK